MLWIPFTTILLAYLQIVESKCECTERIIILLDNDDTFRLVKSPDYPRNYCPGINCIWRVVSSNTSKIYFYAEKLDIRDGKDFIEFYDQEYLSIPENASHVFISGFGDVDNAGFQGTVSVYDRKYAELKQKAVHYFGIPILIITIALIVLTCYCCYKRRNRRDYLKAPTSDRALIELKQ